MYDSRDVTYVHRAFMRLATVFGFNFLFGDQIKTNLNRFGRGRGNGKEEEDAKNEDLNTREVH